jgi:putative RecB family exonuclease
VRYAPDESDLRATVRKIDALWLAIERARNTGDWRPRPSRLCAWCTHQAICPAFGGTPPPLPQLAELPPQPEPLARADIPAQPEAPAQPSVRPPVAEVPPQARPQAPAEVSASAEAPAAPGR